MNAIIRIGLVLYALGTVQFASSQVVYYVTFSQELRYLELSSCTDTLITKLINPANPADAANDCAVGPDGSIYICFTSDNSLYKVDAISGQMTYVTTFLNFALGLVCDAQGVIWGGGYNLFSYDPASDITVQYGVFDLPGGVSVGGDLTFRNGELYMIDGSNKIRKVNIQNPAQSPIVHDLSASGLGAAFGLFSIYYSCDSIVTYTTGSMGFNPKMAEVNFDNGAVTFLSCNFPPNAQINGASTPLEYLGSVPCVQAFALDKDNSSGLTNGDYAGPAAICPHDSLSISDTDIQLLYYKNLDSVQVYFATLPVADSGNEHLTAGSTMGLSYLGNGTSALTMTGQPSAPDSVFRKALLNTVYLNSAAAPSPGIRTIRVIPWSGGIPLDTALAFLSIPITPTGTLLASTCPGVPFVYQGVHLLPGQIQDFTLTNYLGCDSVVTVTVQALPASTGSLAASTCPGVPFIYQGVDVLPGQTQDFNLTNYLGCDSVVTVTVQALVASTGSLVASTCPGLPFVYQGVHLLPGQTQAFTLTNYLGCDSVVTVTVQAFPIGDFEIITQSSCSNLPTGSLNIQHVTGGSAPFQFSLDGIQYAEETQYQNLSAGNQTVHISDQVGCTTELPVIIPIIELLMITLDDATLSCDDNAVFLQPMISGDQTNLQYKWSTGSNLASSIVEEAGLIWVEVSNSCQTVRQEANVRWATGGDSALVYFPNVISLHASDVVNQVFRPFFASELTVVAYRLEVFDRWGNLLFESDRLEDGWDGRWNNRALESGIFVWKMRADVLFCGQQINMIKSGDVLTVKN